RAGREPRGRGSLTTDAGRVGRRHGALSGGAAPDPLRRRHRAHPRALPEVLHRVGRGARAHEAGGHHPCRARALPALALSLPQAHRHATERVEPARAARRCEGPLPLAHQAARACLEPRRRARAATRHRAAAATAAHGCRDHAGARPRRPHDADRPARPRAPGDPLLYLVAAGIAKRGACHLLRHTMATGMLEHGADVRVIQEILGHARLTTTQLYTRVSIRLLKAVHTATHPAARLARPAAPPAAVDGT